MRYKLLFFALMVSYKVSSQKINKNIVDSIEIQNFLDTLNMGGSYFLGKEFPSFNLQSTEGINFTNESLKNKITFINFWFESCSPCIAEMNALNELYKRYKGTKNFQFLSFTFEKKETVERVKSTYKIDYPIFITSNDTCNQLNFKRGYPVNIILSKNGKIAFFNSGGQTNIENANFTFSTYYYPILNSLLNCEK